ncbi:MAG: methyltransferase domain-containing protein [Patescibacteria group bacterium]|jgi:tRNA (guanine10-N2)-dimethyltransferase
MNKYLAVLGNTPELSALELITLYNNITWQHGSIAQLDTLPDIDQLGGTIKTAKIIGQIDRSLAGIEQLKDYLAQLQLPDKKLHFGFSVYAADNQVTPEVVTHYAKKIKPIGIAWKKDLRVNGSVRLVESLEPALSSVIVKKEHLLDQQTDFIIAIYKKHIILGQTLTVQPFEEYAQRDYGRPQRDHFSGMLPPKVAKMMVNIVQPQPAETLLDPFCGSGTVLQEALLLGHKNIIGSDISKKCIEDSANNLAWLKLPNVPLHLSDILQLSNILPVNSINCIVSEGYLGPVHPNKTEKIHRQLTKFYQDVFTVLPKLLAPNARLVIALPAWRRFDGMLTLPLQNVLQQNHFEPFHEPIFYGRAHAQVVRHIYFLRYN